MSFTHHLLPGFTFEYLKEYEVDEFASFKELVHLSYVDRVKMLPRYADAEVGTLELMTDEQLRAMLSNEPAPVKPAAPAPVAPREPVQGSPIPRVRPRTLPEWREAIPRYRAQLWHEGKPVHLGYFMTEQVRDEVVSEARARRNMGLPIRLAK